MAVRTAAAVVLLLLLGLPARAAAQDEDGGAVFRASCASCHGSPDGAGARECARCRDTATGQPGGDSQHPAERQDANPGGAPERRRAARRRRVSRRTADTTGTGRRVRRALQVVAAVPGRCCQPAIGTAGAPASRTRDSPQQAGLTAADLPKLKLKWAFGYTDVTSARAQPALVGNRLFVASDRGDVYALDPGTGCAYWAFRAEATVRTALLVAPYQVPGGASGWAVFFGDLRANAYAVDATTGRPVWIRKVDEHPYAAITGTPAYYDGRIYVPVQGLNEEVQGGRPQYECCTFRGSLSALDASTGTVVWKTYTVGERRSRGTNAAGTPQWGPAGGGIWSAPTIDVRRGAVYVGTGNGYAVPAQPMTDAVVALDIKNGSVRWVNQLTPDDTWTLGCRAKNPDNPNCPDTLGPDYDFSASPALVNAGGRDLLVLPQKSGMAYALDPDKQGALVWQLRIGQGSGRGGQWGGATDGRRAYIGLNGAGTAVGGIVAIDIASGKLAWSRPAEPPLCGTPSRDCNASQGAAVTAIPGAVFSGSQDGGMRAYATDDGTLLWQFDTNREFTTVNGVKAKGGSMDGPGAVVADGLLFVNSGYGGIVGRPGNVLLVFGVE